VRAQALVRPLAQRPQHGVDDVRLAAAVGANNRGQAGPQVDVRLVREGLEAGERELFQVHLG
jgi:hypothetical protein